MYSSIWSPLQPFIVLYSSVHSYIVLYIPVYSFILLYTPVQFCLVLYSLVQSHKVLYSSAQFCTVLYRIYRLIDSFIVCVNMLIYELYSFILGLTDIESFAFVFVLVILIQKNLIQKNVWYKKEFGLKIFLVKNYSWSNKFLFQINFGSKNI